MTLKEVIQIAKGEVQELFSFPLSNVTGACKTDDGWEVTVELLERKCIPDGQDLFGVYEIKLDHEGALASYERKRVRRRMDLEESVG